QEGRFPDLFDRDDLWQLLLTVTERKAIDLVRRERALKRVGPAEPGPAARAEVAELPGREPTPAFAALVTDDCERLLRLLGDDQLRTVAVRKLEGYRNDEIARELACAPRTIERKLSIIRTWWERELGS